MGVGSCRGMMHVSGRVRWETVGVVCIGGVVEAMRVAQVSGRVGPEGGKMWGWCASVGGGEWEVAGERMPWGGWAEAQPAGGAPNVLNPQFWTSITGVFRRGVIWLELNLATLGLPQFQTEVNFIGLHTSSLQLVNGQDMAD